MSPSRYIPLALRLDPLAFQELLKAPREEQTSFVLQVIDKEKRIFRVTLEDRDLGILSFRVGPEGVYGLAGNFQGRDTEMEWNGAYFRVSVSGDEQELKVKLVPLSLPSALEARYSRHFVFGDFLAELRFDFVEKQPCLELKLKNGKEEEALKAKLDTAGIYLSGDLPLVDGERGKVTLEAGGLSYKKGETEGGLGLAFQTEEDNRVSIFLGLGGNPYLEITQNNVNRREIIDAFFTELAQELKRAIAEDPDTFYGISPDITAEEIKEKLLAMVVNEEKTLEVIETINRERQGLVVPDGLRILLNLTEVRDEPIAKFVLPILERVLVLKFNALRERAELSLVYALGETGRTIELGYGWGREGAKLFFQIAEPAKASGVGLTLSPHKGIQSLNWVVLGVAGEIDQRGLELASTVMFGSLLDVLFRAGSTDEMKWSLRYNFGEAAEFKLALPLDDLGYEKSRILLGLGEEGIDLGLRLPFIMGGMLEVKRGSLEYAFKDGSAFLQFFMGQGSWKLEFLIPVKTE